MADIYNYTRSDNVDDIITISSEAYKMDQEIKSLVYIKTNINGYFFDAIFRVDHTSRLTITSHPVQSGSNISDHAYMEPNELAFDIGMSDVMEDIISGQFSSSDSGSRSITAYQMLRKLQEDRIPVQVNTRLKLYKNMLIESMSVADDYKTVEGLRASVTMREVLVAEVTTVKLSSNAQTTDSTNRGTAQPVTTNQSILTQISKLLTGG